MFSTRFALAVTTIVCVVWAGCYAHSIEKRDVNVGRSITYCGKGYPPFFFCPQIGQGDDFTMCCKYELNGKTHYDCCSPYILAGWLIAVIVVVCVVVIGIITACVCCCCGCCGCLSASRPGYVVVR